MHRKLNHFISGFLVIILLLPPVVQLTHDHKHCPATYARECMLSPGEHACPVCQFIFYHFIPPKLQKSATEPVKLESQIITPAVKCDTPSVLVTYLLRAPPEIA